MKHIYYMGEINDTKKLLAQSLGNIAESSKILKNLALCDSVDLLFYNQEKSHFYDKINRNTISLSYLQEDTKSIIGKAFLSKSPYTSYVKYDSYYNVSIDNPYKLKISSQIIFPLIREGITIGIIRFSKYKYTFEQDFIKVLEQLRGALNDVFSQEFDSHAEENYEALFTMNKHDVQASLHTIKDELAKLISDTHSPEIKKLLHRAENNMDSVSEYIKIKLETLNQKSIEKETPSLPNAVRVLIVDDVHMNVKILNAMIKNNDNLDIHFAYDGIEALSKIAHADKEGKGIDVIFLDHYMPGKLGLEVARDIREKEARENGNKMIIVSITNDPSAISKAKGLYDYHVSKPFVKADLENVMHEIRAMQTTNAFTLKNKKSTDNDNFILYSSSSSDENNTPTAQL